MDGVIAPTMYCFYLQLKTKLIGALDSVSAGVKDIEQCSGMLDLVDGLTKDASSTSDDARVSLRIVSRHRFR